MSDKAREIQRNWHQRVQDCSLSTMEIWTLEDEIRDILYEKGYDLINFCNAPCRYGHFNSIDCYTKVAEKLTMEIRKHGFNVILRKNPNKPSISWIIFPYNMVHEIRTVVEEFEVIK